MGAVLEDTRGRLEGIQRRPDMLTWQYWVTLLAVLVGYAVLISWALRGIAKREETAE
jgi:hypothetical protein